MSEGGGKFSVSGENKIGGLIMQRKIFSVLTAIMVAVVICQLSGCSALIDGIGVAGDIASLKKRWCQEEIYHHFTFGGAYY